MGEERKRRAGAGPSGLAVMHDLCHERLWEVLACVSHGPKRMSVIADELEVHPSAVSKYVKPLLAYGLVEVEHHKKEHLCRTSTSHVRREGDRLTVRVEMDNGDWIDLGFSLRSLGL